MKVGCGNAIDRQEPEQKDEDQYDEGVVVKLPVPKLEDTMKRYLDALKPILTDSQYRRVEYLVGKFISPLSDGGSGIGPKLQRILITRYNRLDNWAYDWWLEDMYLCNDACLPINSNPGMVFGPIDDGMSTCMLEPSYMARFAAKFVHTLLHHKRLVIDKEQIPLDWEMKRPICMRQYGRLFTSYRYPGSLKDTLSKTETEYTRMHPHITVVCNNQIYIVRLTNLTEARFITEDEIRRQLSQILDQQMNNQTGPQPPIGLLTTLPRHEWARNRQLLIEASPLSRSAQAGAATLEQNNARNLSLIEQSLFVLCFDLKNIGRQFNYLHNKKTTTKKMMTSDDEVSNDEKTYATMNGGGASSCFRTLNRDETSMLHQMIHGGGSGSNTANRWFDKTIQIVIGWDGITGLCYEHSPAEGVAVINVVNSVLKKCHDHTKLLLQQHLAELSLSSSSSVVQEVQEHKRDDEVALPEFLQWHITDEILKQIKQSAIHIDRLIGNFDLHVMRFQTYGKRFIKSVRVSPDAYVQLALQFTYYRIHGKLTATYESASTRRFLLGRVDCIRSATIEALRWASEMSDTYCSGAQPPKNIENCFQLFKKAIVKQSEILTENINGRGIDVHLLALRQAAVENQIEVDLFLDESYKIANHFALSTSQVTTSDLSFMGYGAVVEDGYGVSYNIHEDLLTFCIASFMSDPMTSTEQFSNCLTDSLLRIRQLLINSKPDKKINQ